MNDNNISLVWENFQKTHDPALRNQLILEYAHIVRYVAGRLGIYLGQHMDFEDLVGYGIFGLIDAIDKFDLLKGVKFESYASLRIRGAIIDSLRDIDWMPRSLRQKVKNFEKAYADLESNLGREPKEQELADKLGITIKEVRVLTKEAASVALISWEDYLEYDTEYNLQAQHDTPESHLNKQQLREILAASIENLTANERLVVTLHYYEELTLREISKVLQVTESRVSQIHGKSLLKMRTKLGEHKHILFS